ncbi:MAG: class I SAM-dependent methyltransferase [Candidatus Omnitrophica bacterium]|nr:class I SAM-dependent methyltransferase [Candidatus Omnitrophota bacterium]
MKPAEREEMLYSGGKRVIIGPDKKILLDFIDDLAKKGDCLDIGCGTGELADSIVKKGFKVSCCDFSAKAVEIARKNYNLNSVLCDLDEGLPFCDSTFDLVVASHVMEHVFDPIFVIKEISRLLKKDGIFLAAIPNDLHISSRLKILFGISYQQLVYLKNSQYKHHTFFSHKLFQDMINKNGLKVHERVSLCRFPKTNRKIKTHKVSPVTNLFADVFIYKIVKSGL